MKTKIKNSLIAALAVATIAGASIGIATLSNNHQSLSQGTDFIGTYSLTAFAEETSAIGNAVALNDASVDVTTTKSVTSADGKYKLYITAIDTGDINVSSAEVGYTYNGINYNGAYEEGKTGLSNVVYSSLSIQTLKTTEEGTEITTTTLKVSDMFITEGFTGEAWLVIAEIPVVENVNDTTLTIKEVVADFAKEFSIENNPNENNPNGAWTYGYVDYHWLADKKEDFDFKQATEKSGDAWLPNGAEIKAGWINVNNMTTIAYKVTKDTDITAVIKIVGKTDNTRLALRVGIKKSGGAIDGNPSFDQNLDGNSYEVTKSLSLKAGDTIYFIFSNEGKVEGAWPQADLSIKLYK